MKKIVIINYFNDFANLGLEIARLINWFLSCITIPLIVQSKGEFNLIGIIKKWQIQAKLK